MFLGILLALGTAICWCFCSYFFSEAGKKVGSASVNHIRIWIALIFLFFIHLFFIGFSVFSQPFHLLLYALVSGAIGFAIGDACLFEAFVRIGPRKSLLIMTLTPAFVALGELLFLGKILHIYVYFSLFLIILGIFLVVSLRKNSLDKTEHIDFLGYFLAFLGAIGQAGGVLLSSVLVEHGKVVEYGKFVEYGKVVEYGTMNVDIPFHPLSINFLRIIAGCFLIFIFSLVRKRIYKDYLVFFDQKSMIFILLGALLGPVLGVSLSLYSMSFVPASITAAIMQTVPIFMTFYVAFFTKEKISFIAWIGTFISVVGAILLSVI